MFINKERIIIDTTKGAHHITRYTINKKAVVKFFLLTILALAIIVGSISISLDKPVVKVHCTNANILVFQDMDDNYIAYVKYANEEQVAKIKSIPNIIVDQSVKEFRYCSTEAHHFEIRLGSQRERVFVHSDNVMPPSHYNYTLLEEELTEMLASSSEETLFLYKELSKIFKTA